MDEDAVARIMIHFDEGLRKVHERLDEIKESCAYRKVECFSRFSEITACMDIKGAVKEEADKHNYIPLIIRSAIVFLTGTGLAFVWKVALHIGG